jgi:hypothetical protein
MLVLGETHDARKPGRAPEPTWLTIPQRGLYTGIMIVGAVGTGKTSACMYPYVDQLLRWRADDPDHKMGGLVMEVKGDFCRQVRSILARAGRESDYVEVGLNSGVCYNPLHNDLDPYAVAYALATLVNNLFGRSKEPFWQQAYTDLLKFVIALRRITVGYTTLAEVYRYIIDEKLIDHNIRSLQAQFKNPGDVLVVRREEHELHLRQKPWTLWVRFDGAHMAHPYEAELETFLAEHGVPFTLRTGDAAIAADRRHRLEAIERWYYNAWARIETDPTGDERAFALSRQARLIPIVATQSLSSLRSSLGGDESWRTLVQCFRTKLFLATSDEFTARMAAELCGKSEHLKTRFTLAEADQGAHISWLTGRAAAPKQTLSASKSYSFESDYVFPPRVFTELQNAQAVVLPYDGLNPLPPQFCYLKPYYLDARQSYFDHLERGAL